MRTAVFAAVAFAAGVSADWTDALSFACPSNTNNECNSQQASGFDWSALSFGSFSIYGDFEFNGWSCDSSFGLKKRDPLTGRQFQDKCITGTASSDTSKAPSFGCGSSKDVTAFSVTEVEISVEFDCDIEFHYGMEDGSTCKQRSSCSSGGSVVKNTQCGGAKSVTVVYPSQTAGSGKGKDRCSIGVHSIGFDCSTASSTVHRTTTTTAAKETTKATTKATTTTSTKATTKSTSEIKTTKSTPATSTAVASTSTSETSTLVQTTSTAQTTQQTTAFTTSTIFTTFVSTIISCAPTVTNCPAHSTALTTVTVALSTTICPVTETETTTSVAATSTSVLATSVEAASTSILATSVEAASTSILATSVAAASTSVLATSVEAASTSILATSSAAASSFITSTSVLATSAVASSSIIDTSSAQTTSTAAGIATSTSVAPSEVITTVVIETSTTVCPVTLTHTTGASTSLETTTSISTVLITHTSTIQTATSVAATISGTTTTTTAAAVTTAACPDVLPQCLNTWLFTLGCSSNTDVDCFCPDSTFVSNVFGCITAHGASSSDITAAQSYLQGICASYVSQNPAIVTAASSVLPDTTGTAAGTVPATTSYNVPITTVQIFTTLVVPCTETTGISAGSVIPSSYTTTVISTSLAVPQVVFQTITATGTGTASVSVAAALVAGTAPAAVAAGTTLATPARTTFQTATSTANGTGTASPATFTGAASVNGVAFGTLGAAIVFAMMVL